MGRISVVIVNWNGGRHLASCLQALGRQTLPPSQIVVVDNASTDGSPGQVESEFPWVTLVRSPRNLGFAAGCNLGFRRSRGELVATLNPDADPEPRWLESLVASIDDRAVGMVASLMLFADRPGTVNSAGVSLDVLGMAWDRLGGAPRELAGRPAEVIGPCAGAALYRRDLLERLGGFDEDFFLYLEDVDLALRARQAGWTCRYSPDAVVHHVHSASAVEGSPFKNYLKARNKVWLIAKNYPRGHLLRWGAVMLAYDLLAAAYGARAGDWSAWRGRLAGLRRLPEMRSRHAGGTGWNNVARLMVGLESPSAVRARFLHLQAVKGEAGEKLSDAGRGGRGG